LRAIAHVVKTTVFVTAALNWGQAMTYAKFRKPNELPRVADGFVGEREPDRVEERVRHEPDQDGDGGREQAHALERLAGARGEPSRAPRRGVPPEPPRGPGRE
jgi:hypothetical protein